MPLSAQDPFSTEKELTSNWFYSLQTQLVDTLEDLEKAYCTAMGLEAASFTHRTWSRCRDDAQATPESRFDEGAEGGGGTSALLKGHLFEKAGVNVSKVYGSFSPAFAGQILGAQDDPRFWASGISVVIHPRSPLVPAVHMNTRFIATTQSWFGGGADLTPYAPEPKDAEDFHHALKACCNAHDPAYYPKFKQAADDYFFLPHRNEPRGIGGIFYDYVNTANFDNDFAFTKDVGLTFAKIYPDIVRRHMLTPWTETQREHQLVRRGRYVEFNLLYDRGTLFGLKTGGHTEAILMSLPPTVLWP